MSIREGDILTAPKIELRSHKPNSTVKLTNDQELKLVFATNQPNLEYSLWTDWGTGGFHDIPLQSNDKDVSGNKETFEIILPADSTGLFKLFIKYRDPVTRKVAHTKFSLNVHVDPDWIYDAIVYNVFFRAYGARGEGNIKPGEGGTFGDVIEHMQEFQKLGINVIYVNPFHVIGDLYRKYNPNDNLPGYLQPGSPYSIKDFKSVDSEVAFPYGDDSVYLNDPKNQFKKFVEAAHKLGIRVFMDLVFNHTAHDFVLQRIFPEWFLYKEDITSAESPYIYFEDLKDGKPWGDPKHTVVPFDHGTFSWTDTAQLNWEHDLPPAPNDPPPNTRKKEMYEYFMSVPKYWIKEFGIDGFRCDMAYHVPMNFWYQCIKGAKEAGKEYYPENGSIDGEVIFIAESFHISLPELFEAGFSFVYGDYSNKIFSPQMLRGYVDYMLNIGTQDYPEGARWFIFPESHDFDRTTSKIVPTHVTEGENLQISERDQVAVRGNLSRWVLTACMPGLPMVFTGFEKVEWAPVEHHTYSRINWDADTDIFDVIAKINQIRHSHVALQKGEYRFVEPEGGTDEGTKIYSFMRYLDDEVMLIVVNMDILNQVEGTMLNLPGVANFDPTKEYILKDLLTGKIYKRSDPKLKIVLDPGDSHIFVIEQDWG